SNASFQIRLQFFLDRFASARDKFQFQCVTKTCAISFSTVPLCRDWHSFEILPRTGKVQFYPLFSIVLRLFSKSPRFGIFIAWQH
ncbi:MAG: hypothetical protein ACREC8_02810, partial [Limisphaerales bacterium]